MFLSWAIKIHRSLYIAITYNKALRISFHFIMVCPRKLRVFQIFSTIHSIGIENSRSAKKASTSGWIAAAALDFFFPFFFFFFWHAKIWSSYRADSLLTHFRYDALWEKKVNFCSKNQICEKYLRLDSLMRKNTNISKKKFFLTPVSP